VIKISRRSLESDKGEFDENLEECGVGMEIAEITGLSLCIYLGDWMLN
jgi:hypothetical protein